MTTKGDLSEEEWSRIARAPFLAAKESIAALTSATNPSHQPQPGTVAG
jgi:hypothetical protein